MQDEPLYGDVRGQSTLLPELLDDYVAENNPVRVVDVFVDELELGKLGFEGVQPAKTERPAYPPSRATQVYIYGYLNRIQSRRRLEREAQRIVGYNVQTTVDAKHLLIVEHEVTNIGSDRDQLSAMAKKARTAIGTDSLTAIVDRGY